MKSKIILLLGVFLIIGCDSRQPVEDETVSKIELGSVLKVTYTEGSFTVWAKTHVETEKGVITVGGTKSVIKGDSAWLRLKKSGKQYVCFESFDSCPKVWGT